MLVVKDLSLAKSVAVVAASRSEQPYAVVRAVIRGSAQLVVCTLRESMQRPRLGIIYRTDR